MLTFVREIEFSDLENMTVETFQVFARRISKGISYFISAPAKPAFSNNALAKPASSITIEIKSLWARHMVELFRTFSFQPLHNGARAQFN